MHSGGSQKEDWAKIYIEAPQKEAEIIFYNRFGHNPYRVTCTCCGEDYSMSESSTLEDATGYHRNCAWEDVDGETGGGHYIEKPDTRWNSRRKLISLEDYVKQDDVLVIYAKDIKPEERIGDLPRQGYYWAD